MTHGLSKNNTELGRCRSLKLLVSKSKLQLRHQSFHKLTSDPNPQHACVRVIAVSCACVCIICYKNSRTAEYYRIAMQLVSKSSQTCWGFALQCFFCYNSQIYFSYNNVRLKWETNLAIHLLQPDSSEVSRQSTKLLHLSLVEEVHSPSSQINPEQVAGGSVVTGTHPVYVLVCVC